MGPLEATKPWSMEGVSGVRRFLDRVWRMIVDEQADLPRLNAAVQDVAPTAEQNRMLHKTIKAVTEDIESMSFNTAIARMMEFVNFFTKQPVRPQLCHGAASCCCCRRSRRTWPRSSGNCWATPQTLAYEPWPEYDEALTVEETIEIPVQINGKLRSRIRVPADASRDDLEAAARADAKIAQLLRNQHVLKTIVVPGRLVNFVTRG